MSMDEIRVRLPRVLDATGSSLRERGRLHPIGPVSITLNITPLHRVTLTLAEHDLPLAMHDLVEVYNQNGSVGVYRVKHIGDTKRKERQIELAHGLDTLSDAHIAVIENYKGDVEGMLRKILAAQKQPIGGVIPWVLGVCEDPNPWTKEIKYDNALECLTDIAKTEEDYMFTFDMSVFPWVLNFVRRDSTVMSEWRMNRNVDQCQISWDDGDQCTRLYLSVTDEDSETVTDKDNQNHTIVTVSEGYYTFDDAEGQADWGIVEKPAGVDRASVPTQAALDAWVAGYFARHRQPALQIQIDGQEYVRITGERLDEAHMGRISRVTMPEYRSVFNERLVSVTYPDALRKPTLVRLSLANKRQTSEGSFAEIRQKASRASSGASSARATAQNAAAEIEKQKIRYDLRVEQDDRHWAIIASGEWFEEMASGQMTLVGKYDANLEVTARKIGAALSVTGVKLDANGMPVMNGDDYVFDGSGNTLSAQLDAQAEQIRAKVSSTDVKNQIEAYGYLKIKSLSTEMGNVFKGSDGTTHAASIVTAVNNSGSTVKISADHVDVDGILTATKINTAAGYAGTLYAQEFNAPTITTSTLKLKTSGNSSDTVARKGVKIAGTTLSNLTVLGTGTDTALEIPDAITDITLDGPTNNEYTLYKKTISNSSLQKIKSFSRAASGVSVSWSGTTGTVTVQPQNQDFTITDDAQVSSVALLKIGSNISIAPYINHGQTDAGGNPTNERNSSAWNISATAPALTGAIPSGHNAGTGVGPAPTAKSAIAPGDTVIPYIQIDGKYFYGSAATVASGANVEASHPHSMTTAIETVTPSNGFDAMAQVVVDASDLVSDTWDAAANVIGATTGGITIPLEGAYGENPNTTKLNLYLKQDANWSSEYKKNVYIRDVDNIVANQGTTIATAVVDASGVYTQGWADAELKLNIPTSSDNPSAFLSISYPDKTKTSKQSSVTYSLTDNSAEHKVQLKVGGNVVAEQAYTPGTTVNVESSHPHTMTANSQTVTPSSGYDAMAQVVVDASGRYYAGKAAVTLNSATWSAWTSSGYPSSRTATVKTSGRTNASGTTDELTETIPLTITSDAPAGSLTVTATVKASNSTIMQSSATCSDSNLTAGNIKSGVTIFGVTGTYEGSGSSDPVEYGVTWCGFTSNNATGGTPSYIDASQAYEISSTTIIYATVQNPDGSYQSYGLTVEPSDDSGGGSSGGGGEGSDTSEFTKSTSLTVTAIPSSPSRVNNYVYIRIVDSSTSTGFRYQSIGSSSDYIYETSDNIGTANSNEVRWGSNKSNSTSLSYINIGSANSYLSRYGGTRYDNYICFKVGSGSNDYSTPFTMTGVVRLKVSGTTITSNTTVWYK